VPTFDIVCLANSRKHQGRCITGLRRDGGGWVRLVSGEKDGTLYPGRHYRLPDGTDPRVLDMLRIDVVGHHPSPHQPENWLSKHPNWHRGQPLDLAALKDLLRPHIEQGPALFGNTLDRIAYAIIENSAPTPSLALVYPGASLQFQVVPDYKGMPRVHARFQLGPQPYNLRLTDPILEKQFLQALPDGVCTRQQAGFHDDDHVLLTVSLGEPFNGYCYKLAAAVIVIPR